MKLHRIKGRAEQAKWQWEGTRVVWGQQRLSDLQPPMLSQLSPLTALSDPDVRVRSCFLPRRPPLEHDLLTQALLTNHPIPPSPGTLLFLHCTYHRLDVLYLLLYLGRF